VVPPAARSSSNAHSARRFVEKQHLRVVHQGDGDAHPAFLSAREGLVPLVPHCAVDSDVRENRLGVARVVVAAGVLRQ